jgi:SOS-response transcriptional repressor LexA
MKKTPYIDGVEEVYEFIQVYLKKYDGLSPTVREIGAGCHIHHSTVLRYLNSLSDDGRLFRHPGKARSIRLRTEETTF